MNQTLPYVNCTYQHIKWRYSGYQSTISQDVGKFNKFHLCIKKSRHENSARL